MRNNAQWNDVLGMLKVQVPDLDLPLLEARAAALDLTETWRRVLADGELQVSDHGQPPTDEE
jgi:hypothetical protein